MANVTTNQKRIGNFVIIETVENEKVTDKTLFNYYDSFVVSGSAHKRAYTALIIPEGVDNIGGYAFNKYPYGSYCKDLKCIYIPDTVKTIQPYSFTGCINVEYIRMSKNVTWIGDNAFANLPKLWKMDIPKNCNYGCKYQNKSTGQSEYKNELNQILPNCPKYSRFSPWIYSASEFGYGTVIYDAADQCVLQESLDMKEWKTIPDTNGKYVVKQDDITRYYRVAEENLSKSKRFDWIPRTRVVKVLPLG